MEDILTLLLYLVAKSSSWLEIKQLLGVTLNYFLYELVDIRPSNWWPIDPIIISGGKIIIIATKPKMRLLMFVWLINIISKLNDNVMINIGKVEIQKIRPFNFLSEAWRQVLSRVVLTVHSMQILHMQESIKMRNIIPM